MNKSPSTQNTLLLRVRDDHDQLAWNEFVEIYAPLIHAYGRHHGLQDADAADLAQDVLQAVAGAIKSFEYDPERGSFRGWLFTVTRNKLRRMQSRRQRQPQGSGGSGMQELLHEQPGRESDEEMWNESHRLRLFHWAADQVRHAFQETTWQAFWQTAVEHRNAKDVAEELNISVGAVYIAKSRVLTKIREKIVSLEPESP